MRTPVEAMNVLDGTQSHSTQAPPMPSRVDDGDLGDVAAAGRGDQRRLIAGGPAADDHDAGCHGLNLAKRGRLIAHQPVHAKPLGFSACRSTPPTDRTCIRSRCWSGHRTRRWPGPGWLHGWRLTFGGEDIGWEGALATVVEDPTSKVFVVLYDMTKDDEENLDRWEGSELGIHKKIRCRVDRTSSDTTTDPVLAWLYVVDAWEGGMPSARYLGVMADAAEIAGAPAEYVHDLRTRPARNIGPGT